MQQWRCGLSDQVFPFPHIKNNNIICVCVHSDIKAGSMWPVRLCCINCWIGQGVSIRNYKFVATNLFLFECHQRATDMSGTELSLRHLWTSLRYLKYCWVSSISQVSRYVVLIQSFLRLGVLSVHVTGVAMTWFSSPSLVLVLYAVVDAVALVFYVTFGSSKRLQFDATWTLICVYDIILKWLFIN